MKVTEVKKQLWLRGWSQDALVKHTGRSKSEISMVLNGRRYTPTVQEAVAAAVGVPVEELFGEWAYLNQKGKINNRTAERVKNQANGRL
jgi:transcriptional regulator with XRE-family HTH domain